MTTSSVLCVICSRPDRPRAAQHRRYTCGRCTDTLLQRLQEIPDLYATINTSAALVPGTGMGGRRSPGHGSAAPINMNVGALTDPRSIGDAHHPHHAPTVIGSWARLVREEVGETPAGHSWLYEDAALLVRRIDWITAQRWVDELNQVVREIRDQLVPVATGERVGTVRIGECTALLAADVLVKRGRDPDADGETGECGLPLRAPLYGDVIRCRCGETWPRARWLILGDAQGVT